MNRRKRRAIWINLSLMFASLAFASVVGELSLRVYFKLNQRNINARLARARKPNGAEFALIDIVAPSDNPQLVYDLLPNRYGTFLGIPYRSNSHGMRGPDTSLAKLDGTWRIVTLGDSTMFGWGVREEESYPRFLEEALNSVDDPQRYEILNFAVPGYNTALEAEIFRTRAAAFSPDLTIIQFDMNDLEMPNFVLDSPSLLTLKRSYVFSFVKGLFVGRDGKDETVSSSVGRLTKVDTRVGFRDQTPARYEYMVGAEGVERALDKLWAATDKPVLHLSDIFPDAWRAGVDVKERQAYSNHVREARARAGNEGRFFFLDISWAGKDFCDRTEGAQWAKDLMVDSPRDFHPNRVRHALFARAIYLSLVENHLLPAGSAHYQRSEAVAQTLWNRALELWRQSAGKGRKSGANPQRN